MGNQKWPQNLVSSSYVFCAVATAAAAAAAAQKNVARLLHNRKCSHRKLGSDRTALANLLRILRCGRNITAFRVIILFIYIIYTPHTDRWVFCGPENKKTGGTHTFFGQMKARKIVADNM